MARTDRQQRQRMDPEKRRGLIVDAARVQFSNAPYEKVSLVDIARDVAASEALIYVYFSSKADLYIAAVEEALDELTSYVAAVIKERAHKDDWRCVIRVAIDAFMRFIESPETGWQTPLIFANNEPAKASRVKLALITECADQLISWLPDEEKPERFETMGFIGYLMGALGVWHAEGCPQAKREAVFNAIALAFTVHEEE